MVRVTVGVEAHTHEFIATAHEDQKFGFSLASGDAAEAVRRVLKADGLRLVGLHSHIGSQIFDAAGFEVAARRVIGLLAELAQGARPSGRLADHRRPRRRARHRLHAGRRPAAARRAGQPAARDRAARSASSPAWPMPRIAVEPGRAIAGPGTVTVYEVGTIKDVELDGGARRRYVSVDGGMSDNIRTALYDAVYDCRLVSRAAERRVAAAVLCRVVGKHCESGDIVVRDCWLPDDLAPGDLVAVAATGAYCYSMASGYNRLPRPAVVAVTRRRGAAAAAPRDRGRPVPSGGMEVP